MCMRRRMPDAIFFLELNCGVLEGLNLGVDDAICYVCDTEDARCR